MTTPRPRISFGKIAHRVGAVTTEQLEEARKLRDETEGDLEQILLESGALSEELAEFVRDAFVRACSVCEDCGRRTDMEERENDFACRCGGTFVALEETMEKGPEGGYQIDPSLLRSEEDLESDMGPVDDG